MATSKIEITRDLVELEVLANSEMSNRVATLRDLQAKIAAMTKMADREKKVVQQYMGTATELVDVDGTTIVTWRKNKDGFRLDAGQVEELYPQIFTECQKLVVGSRVFKVQTII